MLLALLATLAASPVHADAGGAAALIRTAQDALAHGRYTVARQAARAAVAAANASAAAHLALARAALGEGDGITAEAEVARARALGAAAAATAPELARARLLQGDNSQALAIAKTAAPGAWVAGLRVQAGALAAAGNPGAADVLLRDALRRAPRDVALLVDVGRFRQSVGDVAGAIDVAARAVALDRTNAAALLLRAQLVRDQFGLTAALRWYAAARRSDPNNYAILIDQAATLGDAGQATAMLAATRAALAVRPGDPQALYLLAVLAARGGKPALARDLLERTGGALEDQPAALLLRATLDLADDDHEQAVATLRHLVALQPMNIQARQLLATALLGSEDAAGALEVLRPVALRSDADSFSLTLAARAFEAAGDRIAAAEQLDRAALPARGAATSFDTDESVPVLAAAAARDPDGEPSTAIPLIRGLLDAGDGAGALARAQRVADANRGAPGAAIVLGDVLMTLRRPAEAAAAYARAASLVFDEPTLLRLTEAREAAGDRAGAAAALALFLQQNPQSVAARRLAAHWQIADGAYPDAIDTLEGLRARLGNRDAALLAELSFAYDGAGNHAAARSFAAAAYALAPLNAAAADAYGWSLYGTGDAGGALQLLGKAVALAPTHATIRWHLAQLYADLGRPADARAQVALALRDPRFGERSAAGDLLKRLG
ncbi:Tetratricopeptide repeat-containing protein [Sphingomonas guangdongensis]|uniref:Tetratricopeptide repeat-containing protein n=1 Tax=Sphingomonas guangdongensis TaxID=1141890 RepID=A0A285QGL1_9SPHN|nr:Tetratricopeptide repeat-containing protein [Sphingomonas guangdongensis]